MHSLVSVIVPTFNRPQEVKECKESIRNSDYPNIEIIVVDNNAINHGAAGGRNRGVEFAKGEYLLFIDDDNIIDRSMISHLVDFFERTEDCIMVGPLMFFKSDPKRVWLSGCRINMLSSKAEYWGTEDAYRSGYDWFVRTGHLPNCFMVRRKDFEAIGGFDERYNVMYEEADFAYRLKRKFKQGAFLYSAAKIYHNISPCKRPYIFESNERAYLVGRNRIYFMRKNTQPWMLVVFLLVFLPFIFLHYEYQLLKVKEFKMAWYFFLGTTRGLIW
jgi:GT2 family glycosyltransferase